MSFKFFSKTHEDNLGSFPLRCQLHRRYIIDGFIDNHDKLVGGFSFFHNSFGHYVEIGNKGIKYTGDNFVADTKDTSENLSSEPKTQVKNNVWKNFVFKTLKRRIFAILQRLQHK